MSGLNEVLTETRGRLIIRIYTDPEPVNPRKEYDNFGHMVCFHRKYTLGDKSDLTIAETLSIQTNDKEYISLPLYLYDHGGVTMKTTPFNDDWDSGQVGLIYVSKDEVRKEYSLKRNITRERRQKVKQLLRSEVEQYDQYLRGDCYGYKIFEGEKELDSCWGFLGDMDYCLQEARSMCDTLVPQCSQLHCVCRTDSCHCAAFKKMEDKK